MSKIIDTELFSISTNWNTSVDLPLQEMKTYVHKRLIRLWKRGVRDFIETVVSTISVDSGMSVATLLPLATRVRFAEIVRASMAGRRISPRLRRYNSYAFPGQGEFKTPEHGVRLGEDAYQLEFGSPQTPNFQFRFEITVLQFYLHENGKAVPSSHVWQSLLLGQAAFQQRLEREFDDLLPAKTLENYLGFKKVPFQGID